MKLPMPYSPLSLSEAHRRRAQRQSTQFLVQLPAVAAADCAQNEDELEEQA